MAPTLAPSGDRTPCIASPPGGLKCPDAGALVTLEMSPLFQARPLSALTAKGAKELETLGLRPDELEWFCDLFVGHPFDFAQRSSDSEEWPRPRPTAGGRQVGLGRDRVTGHLAGRYWIATNAKRDDSDSRAVRCWTRCVTIDLDAGDDLADRYRLVCTALGRPTCVFQSSASGGVHVVYVLTAPAPLYELRHDGAPSGLVRRLLASVGLEERNGRAEVYPRGTTHQYGAQTPLRLPFGKGSALCAVDTLQPRHDGVAWPRRRKDLRDLRRDLTAGRLSLASVDRWRVLDRQRTALAAEMGETPAKAKARRRQVRGSRSVGIELDAGALLDEGLTSSGQFNDAVVAVVSYARLWLRYTEGEARATLHRWLDEKHNGNSHTYNTKPRAAHRHLDRAIAWAYKDGPYTGRGDLPELSHHEAAEILTKTAPPGACVDPDTGKPLNQLKVRRFVFAALRFGKRWVRERGNGLWLAEVGDGALVTDAQRDRVVQRAARFWPDPTQPLFVVDQPWQLMRKLKDDNDPVLKGVARDSIPAYKRVAAALGLLPMARNYNTGRSRAFGMPLDFGALSPSDVTFASPEAALKVLSLTRRKVETSSRHTSPPQRGAAPEQVQTTARPTSGAARDSTPPLSPFEQLVRARLTEVIHKSGAIFAGRVA